MGNNKVVLQVTATMRLLVWLVLLIVVSLVIVEAKKKGKGKKKISAGKPPKKSKKTKAPKKSKKNKTPKKSKPAKKPKPEVVPEELKESNDRTKDMEAELDKLEKEIAEAEAEVTGLQSAKAESRHIIKDANEFIAIVDATLGGYATKCGSQVVTGWSANLNLYYAKGADVDSSDPFTASSGTFVAPADGWYNVCAFFRFRNTGNSNDVTILKDGSVVAAFGNADTRDWRSTGNCVVLRLTTTNSVTVKHQSGGSSDCIEETGWYYSRFIAHNIAAAD